MQPLVKAAASLFVLFRNKGLKDVNYSKGDLAVKDLTYNFATIIRFCLLFAIIFIYSSIIANGLNPFVKCSLDET